VRLAHSEPKFMDQDYERMKELQDLSTEIEVDIVGADFQKIKDFIVNQHLTEQKANVAPRLLVSEIYKFSASSKVETNELGKIDFNADITKAINIAIENRLNIRIREDGEKIYFCIKSKRSFGNAIDSRQEFEVPIEPGQKSIIESYLIGKGFVVSAHREKFRTSFKVNWNNKDFKIDFDQYPPAELKNESSVRAEKIEVEGDDENSVSEFANYLIKMAGSGGSVTKSSERNFLKTLGYKKDQIENLKFNYE